MIFNTGKEFIRRLFSSPGKQRDKNILFMENQKITANYF